MTPREKAYRDELRHLRDWAIANGQRIAHGTGMPEFEFIARVALEAAAKAEAEAALPVLIERCNATAWNGERCVMGKDDGHAFHAGGRSTWPVHR